jgi:hypothetical protein
VTTALEIPSHARAQQSDSCAGHDPHCRSTLPCIFVNALRRLNSCMFKRRLSASKPAAEPQIAAASHGVGRRSWHLAHSTIYTPTRCFSCTQAASYLPARSLQLAPSSNGDSNSGVYSHQRSSDPRPPRQTMSSMQFNMPLHLC